MSVKIVKATEDDYRDIAAVVFDSFLENEHPYADAFYQHHDTPAGRELATQRSSAIAKADTAGTYLKMLDVETEKLIGQGRWQVVHPNLSKEYGPSTLSGDYWDTDEDREFAQWCANKYTERRREKFREARKPVFAITSLAVLPQFQVHC